MSEVITVFLWMVGTWNWLCQHLSMSGEYLMWHQYSIIVTELDILTESTILVWLCRRYSAAWILGALELGLVLLVCVLVLLSVKVTYALLCLCQWCIVMLLGRISKILRKSRSSGGDSSGGSGDRGTGATGAIAGEYQPRRIEDIGTSTALAWEALEPDSNLPSRRLTIDEEDLPSVTAASTTTILRRSSRHIRTRNRSRSWQS